MQTTSGMPGTAGMKPIEHPGSGPNWFSPITAQPCACGTPNHSACSVTDFNRRAWENALRPLTSGMTEALKEVSQEQEARARGMQQANAVSKLLDLPWESISTKERNHWRYLAAAGDLAVASFNSNPSE